MARVRSLLFFSYWSSNEPLTMSTVLPTVRMLLANGLVERITLCTVERGRSILLPAVPGMRHVPFTASTWRPKAVGRAVDMALLVPRLMRTARDTGADMIMARGVVAGGFAHRAYRKSGIPYAVDYFEPHADYMADAGEWHRNGVLYRSLQRLIQAQLRTASFQVTVSNNYRERLIAAGADGSRILVAPCPPDLERMRFDAEARERLRDELGWRGRTVGVYLGKFGGLYHRAPAFRAFAQAQQLLGPDHRQFIITPQPIAEVREGLRAAGCRMEHFEVRNARHDEVPAYLSASDLAWGTYRGTPSSACISPMKVGEYWANGLPVLLTRGVGDDSVIIQREPDAGAVFDPEGNDLAAAIAHVSGRIALPGQRERTTLLAARYRGMDHTLHAYERILARIGQVANG